MPVEPTPRLLTDNQVEAICFVSRGLLLGIIVAGSCGVLTGAIARALRKRSFLGLFSGAIYGVMPAMVCGTVVSLGITIVEMVLCPPGLKGSWAVPFWAECGQITTLLITGAIAARAATADRGLPKSTAVLLLRVAGLSILGAVFGAVINSVDGFSGYFVAKVNTAPVYYAVTGAVIGGTLALLWCNLAYFLLLRSTRTRWSDQKRNLMALTSLLLTAFVCVSIFLADPRPEVAGSLSSNDLAAIKRVVRRERWRGTCPEFSLEGILAYPGALWEFASNHVLKVEVEADATILVRVGATKEMLRVRGTEYRLKRITGGWEIIGHGFWS